MWAKKTEKFHLKTAKEIQSCCPPLFGLLQTIVVITGVSFVTRQIYALTKSSRAKTKSWILATQKIFYALP